MISAHFGRAVRLTFPLVIAQLPLRALSTHCARACASSLYVTCAQVSSVMDGRRRRRRNTATARKETHSQTYLLNAKHTKRQEARREFLPRGKEREKNKEKTMEFSFFLGLLSEEIVLCLCASSFLVHARMALKKQRTSLARSLARARLLRVRFYPTGTSRI